MEVSSDKSKQWKNRDINPNMTQDDYDYWHNVCRKVARKYGAEHVLDDFMSDMITRKLEGRKCTVELMFIDYLRSHVFNGRTDKRVKPHNGWHLKIGMDVAYDDDYMGKMYDNHTSDLFAMIRELEGDEHVIAMLYYHWGMEMKEIGQVFGVSESRISQKMTEMHVNLSKKLIRLEGNA